MLRLSRVTPWARPCNRLDGRRTAPAPGLHLGREYGYHQSPAVRAAGLIFCSGMLAINPETGEREHGKVTSEARRIFKI